MNAQYAFSRRTVAQAKRSLSKVIEQARQCGPQLITCNGEDAVVVLDAALWEGIQKRERQGSFLDFMRASSPCGVELEVERLDGNVRTLII